MLLNVEIGVNIIFDHLDIQGDCYLIMVGPRDGGFGFDGSPKYSELDGKNDLCVQCQAGQHSKCLAKNNSELLCDCELCLNS